MRNLQQMQKAVVAADALIFSDPRFNACEYLVQYESSVKKLAQVKDWQKATDEQLHDLIRGASARHVACLNWGELRVNEFDALDHDKLREICSEIRRLADDISNAKVEALCDDFLALLPRKLKALFYRTVTILNVNRVVQVPDGTKLVHLHDWLTGETWEDRVDGNWFALSSRVRTELGTLLPGFDHYRLGVLAWFLANAFRDNLKGRLKVQKDLVLQVLKDNDVLKK